MKYITVLVLGFVLLGSCKKDIPKEWVYQKTIPLDGVNPIGIAAIDGTIWLSDGDHNRIVKVYKDGIVEVVIDSLDRPMHIDSHYNLVYVPQYGNDKVELFYPKDNLVDADRFKREEVAINDSLDAPSSVAVFSEEMAITDFYNNRVLFRDNEGWISFGREGSKEGEFYYPTDVQITEDKIWVADAYNNRIQVFDKEGNFIKMIGQDQKMNAATGLFVSKNEVFITDFENKRVLIFDHNGVLKQELKEGVKKATDLLVKDNVLHIINYRAGELVLYNLHDKKV